MKSKEFKKRITLQFKFSISVILLIVFLYAIMSKVIIIHEEQALTQEIKKRIVTQGKGLARTSQKLLLQEDPEFFLCPLIKRIADEDKDIVYAVVVDAKGKIKGTLQTHKIDTYYQESKMFKKNALLFHISIPIYQNEIRLGTVYIGFSRAGINQSLKEALNNIRYITLIIMLIGIIISFFLVRFIVSPVKALCQGVEEIGKENFDYSIDIKTRDEIGELTVAFNKMAKSLKEKKILKNTFERYVSKEVVNTILQDMDNIHLGGEKRKVTILLADIHGFTQLSEKMEPEEVVDLLNEYFTRMTEIIFKYEGTLDKFMGDALLVVYGAPIFHQDDAQRAVKTAIEMRQCLEVLNRKWITKGKEPIQIGIGITTGNVIVGNIGSEKRMNYTVVGDCVNLVARLQDLTGDGQIFIDKDTYIKTANIIEIKKFKPIKIKGLNMPIEIYEALRVKK